MVDSTASYPEVIRGLLGLPDAGFDQESVDNGQSVQEVSDTLCDLGAVGGTGSSSFCRLRERSFGVHRSSVTL